MRASLGLLAALVAAIATATAAAPAAAKTHWYVHKVAKFQPEIPTYVATPPAPAAKGRLFVVARNGRIWIIRKGKLLKRPFLDIRGSVLMQRQRGLFTVAFAPDYSRSGRFYIEYVHGPDDTVRLDEFHRLKGHPNQADPASRRTVINVGRGSDYHHGGQVAFGPDGYLYMSTGMADAAPSAQRLSDLHGKILRIDPRARDGRPYTVPPDNPFVFTQGARPEIWAYGLRNPWRFSFDSKTGDMAIGDVGESSYEEVDFVPAGARGGANFGWPIFEGAHKMEDKPTPADYVPPVMQYRHGPMCAVMSGYVVRDPKLYQLNGRYLWADFCTSPLRIANLAADGATGVGVVPGVRKPGIVSFGEDLHRHIYMIASDGVVYRLLAYRGKTR